MKYTVEHDNGLQAWEITYFNERGDAIEQYFIKDVALKDLIKEIQLKFKWFNLNE